MTLVEKRRPQPEARNDPPYKMGQGEEALMDSLHRIEISVDRKEVAC